MRQKRTGPWMVIVGLGIVFLAASVAQPCTLAVVSGKAARGGRPLMWKNRDTSVVDNKVLFFKGARYAFIGLVDAGNAKEDEVYAGLNSEGLAVMNAQSSDLAEPNREGMGNGAFMKLALGECRTAGDFEALIRREKGKWDLAAIFGVIDAEGNACFFETGPSVYQRFDARDPRVAPFGYLVRTNFAFTSPDPLQGGGFIRFERASRIFQAGRGQERIDAGFILREGSRDLVHEKLQSYPLTRALPDDPASPLYINTNDTINRNSSVAAAVFEGAPSPDKAYLATMWTLLGQPVTSAAVPLWVRAGRVPSVATGAKTSPLCDLSKSLVAFLYPDKRGRMKQYLSVTRLRTSAGDGILPTLFRVEGEAMARAAAALAEWEKAEPDPAAVAGLQEEIASRVYERLKAAFSGLF